MFSLRTLDHERKKWCVFKIWPTTSSMKDGLSEKVEMLRKKQGELSLPHGTSPILQATLHNLCEMNECFYTIRGTR